MKKKVIKISALIIFSLALFASCDKHEVRPNPTLSFATADGYTFKDTTIAAGDTVQIGLQSDWNGTDLLKTLSIYVNNIFQNSYAIPGDISQSGILNLKIIKTKNDSDGWGFEIADINGQKAFIGILLTKDKTGGQIDYLQNITLGAQNNQGTGNFFSISESTVYTLANATSNQQIIDMVLGYNATDKAYLASPNANLTGDYDLSSWTTKNSIMYCTTTYQDVNFDMIDSDLLLISAYDETKDTEKAIELQKGKIYSFKSSTGKPGLIKVLSTASNDAGTAGIEIKIQK
jgi:hypothetical protein